MGEFTAHSYSHLLRANSLREIRISRTCLRAETLQRLTEQPSPHQRGECLLNLTIQPFTPLRWDSKPAIRIICGSHGWTSTVTWQVTCFGWMVGTGGCICLRQTCNPCWRVLRRLIRQYVTRKQSPPSSDMDSV